MTLVAACFELVSADLESHESLARLLNAVVPENWPPDLYERQAMRYALEQLRGSAEQVGWSFWYLLSSSAGPRELLGICGFSMFSDGLRHPESNPVEYWHDCSISRPHHEAIRLGSSTAQCYR